MLLENIEFKRFHYFRLLLVDFNVNDDYTHFFFASTATAVEEKTAMSEFTILIPVTLISASSFDQDLNLVIIYRLQLSVKTLCDSCGP